MYSQSIVQTLAVLVTKAYRMAHKRIPSDDEIVLEASNLANSLESIPVSKVPACYEFARLHYDDIPTARLVMKAWDKEIKNEGSAIQANPRKQITHQSRPDEHWRDLVTARMLGYIPYPTDWMVKMYSQEPTHQEMETFCLMVREAAKQIPEIVELKAQTNPYGISADQIRSGLPKPDGNASPIYLRN